MFNYFSVQAIKKINHLNDDKLFSHRFIYIPLNNLNISLPTPQEESGKIIN